MDNSEIAAFYTKYTMPTTVRVRTEDKKVLDRIQARMTLAHGRMSLDEVLHHVIRLAERHESEMVLDEGPKLTKKEIAYILSQTFDTRKPSDHSTIDEELYGWDSKV